MCTGLELLAAASLGTSAISAMTQKAPSAPPAPDPANERAAAEAEAAQKTNAKIAMQRRAMRANSLMTGAGEGTLGAPAAAPAAGRTTLGV